MTVAWSPIKAKLQSCYESVLSQVNTYPNIGIAQLQEANKQNYELLALVQYKSTHWSELYDVSH